jgi:cell division protein FtsL
MARHLHAPVRQSRERLNRLAGGTMDNVRLLTQAYSQAPWRKQIQFIVLFMLILVMGALIAGIYLNISARSVASGVEIQEMESDIEDVQRSIQDLETQLAFMTSSSTMEERAKTLGMQPADASQIEYLVVPGYTGKEGPSLAPSPEAKVIAAPGVSPEFTESIIDWFIKNVLGPSGVLEVGQ